MFSTPSGTSAPTRAGVPTSEGRDDPQTAAGGPSGGAEPMDPFEWIKSHPWPRERSAGPRPVLTPEQHAEMPLTPEERRRRAVLLTRLREANHPRL